MNEPSITVDGIPLEDVLAFEQSKEIAQHMTTEVRTLAKECGIRRCSSTPQQRLCRSGRPMRGVSTILLAEIEPYLKDDELLLRDVAELFGISVHDVKFYQRRLKIQRKRGRKCKNPHVALDKELPVIVCDPKPKSFRLKNVTCRSCSYTMRVTEKWMDKAVPKCPSPDCDLFGEEMEVA